LVGSTGLPIAFREICAYIGGCASTSFVAAAERLGQCGTRPKKQAK
jgi:hypothetical protein